MPQALTLIDVENQIEIWQSFENAIKAFPGMKIIVTKADKADMAIGMQKLAKSFDRTRRGPSRRSRVDSGLILVTRENIHSYKTQMNV